MLGRRTLLGTMALAAAAPGRAHAQGAQAQGWQPQKPLQIIVGFAPGGGSDIVARGIQQAAQELMPQPILVVNRPGAAGVLAAQQVAQAAPDGHTLLVTGGSESTSVPHYREVSYDPQRDFRHVILVARYPLVMLVKADSPFRTPQQLVAEARRSPGKLTYGSSGVASLYQSVFVVLGKRAGIDMLHVPYTGGAPALTAVAAGEVTCTVATPDECKAMVEGGVLRPIGVASRERFAEYPEAPTLIESGWDVYMENLKGLSVPAATPAPVVAALYDVFHRALATPTWRSFAQRVGITTADKDGPAFTQDIQAMSDAISAAVKG